LIGENFTNFAFPSTPLQTIAAVSLHNSTGITILGCAFVNVSDCYALQLENSDCCITTSFLININNIITTAPHRTAPHHTAPHHTTTINHHLSSSIIVDHHQS
jgi:hypothetical protein